MKNYFTKAISLLLVLLMTLSSFALVACNKDEGNTPNESNNDETPAQNETEQPVENTKVEINVANLSEYYIVRPDTQNKDMIDSVKALYTTLEETFSVKTKGITTDFILPGNDTYKEHEYEIIIGETNREASAAFTGELKYSEYGYAVVGNKIVIAGCSVADTVLAVEKFIADVITPNAGKDVIVLESDKYIQKVDFKFDTISINGTDISEFDIVYKKTKQFQENEIAEFLKDSIGRLCGAKINTVLMNTTSAIKNKQIVITDSPALTDAIKAEKDTLLADADPSTASIVLADENIVWICGETLAGILDSANQLVKMLDSSADGKATVASGLHTIENEAIRCMSYNVLVGSDTENGFGPVGERKKGVINTILKYAPDILGVQEASNEWMTILKLELGKKGFDCVGLGRDTANNGGSAKSVGEHSAIFYNKDKYTLVESNTYWLTDTPNVKSCHPDSDYIRIMTYAIFERKSDGFRFMHVNTHLDFANKVQLDQVTKMLELIDNIGFEGLTFSTGDYNMRIDYPAYQLFLEAGFVNAFDEARIKSEPNIKSMIDFVLVRDTTADILVENHFVANDQEDKVYNEDMFPSDHCAVYATIVPNVK